MAQTPQKPGFLTALQTYTDTVRVGLLILFGLALLHGTLSVLFP